MEKSYVTLEQKICVICGNKHDTNALLFDQRLIKKFNKHTVTGYDHCDDCQSKVDDDYIAMVEISNTPSDEIKTIKKEEADRTGVIVWVKKHLADEVFNTKITTPVVFVEPKVVEFLTKLKEQEI